MPTWEETKRAGQTAFLSQENSVENRVQAAHESVDTFYRQLLTKGYVSLTRENNDLTHQIADQVYEPSREDWKEYEQYVDQHQWPEHELGIDMEPGR